MCNSRFSCVSVAFQLRLSSVEGLFFVWNLFGSKISAFLKVRLLVKFLLLCFSCVSAGKNGVLTLCIRFDQLNDLASVPVFNISLIMPEHVLMQDHGRIDPQRLVSVLTVEYDPLGQFL